LYNPPPAHSQEQPGENGASGSAASSSGGSNGEGSAGAGVSNGPVISGPTRDVVRETLSTSPATAPTSNAIAATPSRGAAAPGVSSGQYMTLGAVIVEVNGTPIYADKVVNQLTP